MWAYAHIFFNNKNKMKTKITTQHIEEIKQAIEEFEYKNNGFHNLNGASIEVRNLRVRKNKALADVVLIYSDDKKQEIHEDLEYDINKLGVEIE